MISQQFHTSQKALGFTSRTSPWGPRDGFGQSQTAHLRLGKKKKEEHMFQISLNGQKYFFQSENQKILRALRLMLILQVAQDMRTSRSL